MKLKLVAIAASAIGMGVLAAYAQDRFAAVEIKTTAAAGTVHMLEGSGGNIGVSAGEDGILMIDSQFAPLSDKIKAALKTLGGGMPRYLINTHVHGDHVGGNQNFGKEASIVAHANVRKRMRERRDGAPPKVALPVVTYDDGLSIHFNDEEVEVVHFPAGHTDGDSVIFFKSSNVVHLGDHFFVDRFPFVDLNSGGNVAGFIKNVDKAMAMITADMKIIPGHGPLSSIDDLKRFRGMLEETTTMIRKHMADGKSLEDIQAAGLPAKWTSWGTGFISTERWIETVYRSYSS